jgi:small subunit ribosomal protein S3
MLYEMDGVTEELAREAFRLAAAKLPLKTTYGIIGVKVWVYKGERLASGEAPVVEAPVDEERKRRGPRRDDGKPGSGRPSRGPRPDGGTGRPATRVRAAAPAEKAGS